jgi:hypothetical protein
MSDLQTLVNEYNETEKTQAARLKAIYDLAAQQPGGGHEIRFSDGTLWDSNFLGIGHNLHPSVLDRELSKQIRLIVNAA